MWIICFVGVLLCSQGFIVNVGVSIWNESLPRSLFEWLCCHLKSLGEIIRVLFVGSCWLMIREFSHFSSSPVLASAICLCCCHFDMSNRLVASFLFTHLCLFYFVFSCCCFDNPQTSFTNFVCSVDNVKLEMFKMVDVLTFHYLHKLESWSFLPSTIFLESAFPNAVMYFSNHQGSLPIFYQQKFSIPWKGFRCIKHS